ncbi:MAG TPA: DUF2939 domain-containing protein [Methylomirabilota bacterium]
MRWLLPAAALLLSALVVWYYLMGTPQYSLYRLAAAIHGHDAAAVGRFIDVDRIAQAASETMAGDYLEHEPRAAQALEALGQGGARATAARALKPLVADRVRAEIAKMAREGDTARGALALPAGLVAAFWRVAVVREPPDAWVTYKDPGRGQTRFRMSQQPDRSWRITEFDRDWIRRQVRQPAPR